MDVAVRELKAKLSSYLARAAAGEVLTITDRDRPIALISPLPGRVDIAAAVKAGWVQPATRTALVPVRRRTPTGSVSAALAEDRGQ